MRLDIVGDPPQPPFRERRDAARPTRRRGAAILRQEARREHQAHEFRAGQIENSRGGALASIRQDNAIHEHTPITNRSDPEPQTKAQGALENQLQATLESEHVNFRRLPPHNHDETPFGISFHRKGFV